VISVPPGPVAEVSAAARGQVGGRPVVALGGGRVVDSAKAIGAADGVPVAAVTTTLSGAELTGFHRLPQGVEGKRLVRPSLVIADPELMASAPMPLLAASALNALAHAVEALYTPMANPVASMAALRGTNLIASGLGGEGEPDREELALGALLAAYASGAAGYAVHHVVCQTIVRVGGTPHAQTNATMLPHSLRLMRSRAAKQIVLVERELGAAGGADRLARRAEVSGLRALGFDPAQVDEVVAAVLPRPELANTPDPPGEAELRAFVEGAL
jgi:alcohol dehydrogenase class IV